MSNRSQVTGHQPVEPDKGPGAPLPPPTDKQGQSLPHQRHHDPEEPDADEAD
ncbi:MAG TPA: hypothetical protein VLC92_05565 [Rhodocyclaceae bacterium]|nr:hypothetical protein [Rhodocyclaceae bacterium]